MLVCKRFLSHKQILNSMKWFFYFYRDNNIFFSFTCLLCWITWMNFPNGRPTFWNRILKWTILISVGWGPKTINNTFQWEVWDHHAGFVKEVVANWCCDLSISPIPTSKRSWRRQVKAWKLGEESEGNCRCSVHLKLFQWNSLGAGLTFTLGLGKGPSVEALEGLIRVAQIPGHTVAPGCQCCLRNMKDRKVSEKAITVLHKKAN